MNFKVTTYIFIMKLDADLTVHGASDLLSFVPITKAACDILCLVTSQLVVIIS